MATFARNDADIAAVYFRRSTGPADNQYKLVRAPFNLVTYDDGTSGLEPVPASMDGVGYTPDYFDGQVNRVEFYDRQPFAEVAKIDTILMG